MRTIRWDEVWSTGKNCFNEYKDGLGKMPGWSHLVEESHLAALELGQIWVGAFHDVVGR